MPDHETPSRHLGAASIDAALALQVEELLGTAIAGLFEDEHLAMVTHAPLAERGSRARQLTELGGDVAKLAAALEVIARRAEPFNAQP